MNRKTRLATLLFVMVMVLVPAGVIAEDKAPATVTIAPVSPSVGVGSIIAMDIYVQNVVDFYGIQFVLRFNKTLLDGVSVVEGTAFTGAGFGNYMVPQKIFDGNRVRFAASLVGVPSLTGPSLHVARIEFRGKSPGTSPLIWESVDLANDAGAAIPHFTQDGQIVVTDAIDVRGFAFMQGRTNHAGITVELSGPVINTTPTGADGRYAFYGVPAGTYNLDIAHELYVTTQLMNCTTGGGLEYNPPTVTLLAGDLTKDQNIDIMDLAKCGGAFGSADPTSDINADGIVDLFDLVLIGINFGTMGPTVITCP